MRKLLITLALLGMSLTATASPMRYTFEGVINLLGQNGGTSVLADAGLTIGQNVSYTFDIDHDRDPQATRYDGTVYNSWPDSPGNNYFWSDYVSGDAFLDDSLGRTPQPFNTKEFNWGQDFVAGDVFMGSNNAFLEVFSGHNVLSKDWEVGYLLNFQNFVATSGTRSYWERIRGSGTLVSITDPSQVADVPVPGTIALMGIGLMGLLFNRKRRLQATTV